MKSRVIFQYLLKIQLVLWHLIIQENQGVYSFKIPCYAAIGDPRAGRALRDPNKFHETSIECNDTNCITLLS